MDSPLTRDLITDPSIVQLKLRLSDDALDIMLYNPMEDNSLIHRKFPISGNSEEKLKALENIIYDNPLLLSDFSKTSILVETRRFLIIPSEANIDDNAGQLIKISIPTLEDDAEIIVNPIGQLGADIVTALERPTANFLRRTFNNAPVSNNLVPLAIYFQAGTQEGNSVRTLVNLRSGSLDLITLSHNRLILANRFEWRDINDAAYYVLACAGQPEQTPDQIIICGTRHLRDWLTPILRQFHPYVMPMIFPSEMYRAGASAMSLPFDLVIMPLCE